MPFNMKTYESDVRAFAKEGDALFRRLRTFCRKHGIEGRSEHALSRIVDGYSDLNQRICEYVLRPDVDSDRFAADINNAIGEGSTWRQRPARRHREPKRT